MIAALLIASLFGCRSVVEPSVMDGDIPTTKMLTFEGPSGEGWVEYWTSKGEHFQTSAVEDDQGTYTVTAVGVPLGEQVKFQAVIDSGGKLKKSPTIKDEWPLPDLHPTPEVRGDWNHELLMIHFARGSFSFGTVVDKDGQVIWVRVPDIESDRVVRALPYEGGVAWLESDEWRAEDTGRIGVQAWSGGQIDWTKATRAHHDFRPHDDGFVFLGHESTPREGFGDATWADDVVRYVPAGGTAEDNVVVHQLATNFPPIVNCDHVAADTWVPGEVDWTHANSIVRDGDGWMVMVRYFDTIVRLNEGFKTDFLLGGPYSDVDVPRDLNHGHFSQVDGDRIYIFDNQDHGTKDSMAVALDLDRNTLQADLAWTQRPDEPGYIAFLGDVQVLPDGTRLVVSGSKGIIDSFDENGEWQGSLTLPGSSIGRINVVNLPKTRVQ